MKHNILFLLYNHAFPTRGGVERVTNVLTEALLPRHDVYQVSVCKPWPGDTVRPYQFFLPNDHIASNENLQFLIDFVREKKIDVVVNQNHDRVQIVQLLSDLKNCCANSANNAKIPIVTVVHCDPLVSVKSVVDKFDFDAYRHNMLWCPYLLFRKTLRLVLRKRYARRSYNTIYQCSDKVVLLSQHFIPKFLQLIDRQDDDRKVVSISNPAAYSETCDMDFSHKEKVVLYVGRLTFVHKRVDRLLKAWSRIKDRHGWRLVIVGDGESADFYRQMAHKLGLDDVEFAGHQNPSDYYRRASVLCVTSTCEGFGLVFVEAMQRGVVPIAYDSFEAVRDIIKPCVNGILVDPFSIKKYSEAISSIVSHPDKLHLLQQNMEVDRDDMMRKFGIENIVRQWENLFDTLV